jgi:hypothetical protein
VFDALKVIFRRRGEPKLCAHEILEDCAIVAADRAVRFIADNELEIGRRELMQKSITRREALDCSHNNLCLLPIIASLFVNDGFDSVIGQVVAEISLGLLFQLHPIDQKQNAARIFGAQIKLRDRRAQQRLARARGHFEKEPILSTRRGALQRPNCIELVIAQQPNLLIDLNLSPIGR